MWTTFLLSALIIQIAHSSSIKELEHCSHTFYSSSDNKICRDDLCHDVVTSSFQLRVRDSVCFISEDDSIIKYTIKSAYRIYRFKIAYETCTSQYTLSSHYRCWWAGECNYEQCRLSNKQDHSISPALPRPTHKNSLRYYTGCLSAQTCRGYCGWDQANRCGWGLIEIVPISCFPIYHLASVNWQLSLLQIDGNSLLPFSLSSENPFQIEPYSLSIKNFLIQTPEHKRYNSLIRDGKGVFHLIESSARDQPIAGTFGETQRSTVDGSFIHYQWTPDCSMDFCKFDCNYPVSMLNRLGIPNGSMTQFRELDIVLEDNSKTILLRQEVDGVTEIQTNIGKIKGINVKSPNCEIEVLSSVGCIECHDNGVAYFQAKETKVAGIVEFRSNCTFDSYLLRCQSLPYHINLLSSSQCCYIEFVTKMKSNQTSISFCPDYIFTGSLHKIEYLTTSSHQESLLETGRLLLTSPNFYKGVFIIGGSITLLSLSIRLIGFLVTIYSARKLAHTPAA